MLLGITSPLVEDRAQQTLRVQTPPMTRRVRMWVAPLASGTGLADAWFKQDLWGRYVDPRGVTT